LPARVQIEVPDPAEKAALLRELDHVFSDRSGQWFVSVIEPADAPNWHVRAEGPSGYTWSSIFEGPEERAPTYVAAALRRALSSSHATLRTLFVEGFGPFATARFNLESMTVVVGANGSGKTSLFELLRAIREFGRTEVPPEIIPGWHTRDVFHRPGPDRLTWRLFFDADQNTYFFGVDIIGPAGSPSIRLERITVDGAQGGNPVAQLERRGNEGSLYDAGVAETEIRNQRTNQLALRTYVNPGHSKLHWLKEQIDAWRFFSGIRFNDQQLRQPALIEENPTLRDDGGNLGSVLHWLQTEYPAIFRAIEQQIRGIIPGFKGLAVRPSGAGRVTITWDEEGLVNPFSTADLSDGSLRLLLWLTLALTPKPPSLVCIDEPEVGMHPRTLPRIAALLKKLSTRTQVIVATHSSYFLAQFAVTDVAVLRKQQGSVTCSRPADSAALIENLREFGADELELMHRSDELEALS
jgi:predicted ATPase